MHFVVTQSVLRVKCTSFLFELDVDSDDKRCSTAPGLPADSDDLVAQVRPAKAVRADMRIAAPEKNS